MTTIHFVYPHGESISCPDAIGRNVGERLRNRYHVIPYNWDDTRVIKPGSDDVLLGHPHPVPWTIFRRSAKQVGWKRILALSPYHHGDTVQVAFIDRVITRCDLYLAITGSYWYNTVDTSVFAHWAKKLIHLDLAIDRSDYPIIKRQFNPPGKRRFLYIGHSGWQKNTHYLSQIAQLMPQADISWIGSGKRSIPGLIPLGRHDFKTAQAKQLVAQHDFMITVGNADANPSTILEAMAWGLIPICTPQSGYTGFKGIQNIPLNNVKTAIEILQELQYLPESHLQEMQRLNWNILDKHFNWDRFTNQIITAIESNASPELGTVSFRNKALIRWAELTSPYSMFHPLNFRTTIKTALKLLRGREDASQEYKTAI